MGRHHLFLIFLLIAGLVYSESYDTLIFFSKVGESTTDVTFQVHLYNVTALNTVSKISNDYEAQMAGKGLSYSPISGADVKLYLDDSPIGSCQTGEFGNCTITVNKPSVQHTSHVVVCGTYKAVYEGSKVGDVELYSSSSSPIQVCVANANPISSGFANFMDKVKQSPQLKGTCVSMAILLSLLLVAMYVSGRDPFRLLDITSPRLPAARKRPHFAVPMTKDKYKKELTTYRSLAKGLEARRKKIIKGLASEASSLTGEESSYYEAKFRDVYDRTYKQVYDKKIALLGDLNQMPSTLASDYDTRARAAAAVAAMGAVKREFETSVLNTLDVESKEQARRYAKKLKLVNSWFNSYSKMVDDWESRRKAVVIDYETSFFGRTRKGPVSEKELLSAGAPLKGIAYDIARTSSVFDEAMKPFITTGKVATAGVVNRVKVAGRSLVNKRYRERRRRLKQKLEEYQRSMQRTNDLQSLEKLISEEGFTPTKEQLENIGLANVVNTVGGAVDLDSIREAHRRETASFAAIKRDVDSEIESFVDEFKEYVKPDDLDKKPSEKLRLIDPGLAALYERVSLGRNPDIVKDGVEANLLNLQMEREIKNAHVRVISNYIKKHWDDENVRKFADSILGESVESYDQWYGKLLARSVDDRFNAVLETMDTYGIGYVLEGGPDHFKEYFTTGDLDVIDDEFKDIMKRFLQAGYTFQSSESSVLEGYSYFQKLSQMVDDILSHPEIYDVAVITAEDQIRRYIELSDDLAPEIIKTLESEGFEKGLMKAISVTGISSEESILTQHLKHPDSLRSESRSTDIKREMVQYMVFYNEFNNLIDFLKDRGLLPSKTGDFKEFMKQLDSLRTYYARELSEFVKTREEDEEDEEDVMRAASGEVDPVSEESLKSLRSHIERVVSSKLADLLKDAGISSKVNVNEIVEEFYREGKGLDAQTWSLLYNNELHRVREELLGKGGKTSLDRLVNEEWAKVSLYNRASGVVRWAGLRNDLLETRDFAEIEWDAYNLLVGDFGREYNNEIHRRMFIADLYSQLVDKIDLESVSNGQDLLNEMVDKVNTILYFAYLESMRRYSEKLKAVSPNEAKKFYHEVKLRGGNGRKVAIVHGEIFELDRPEIYKMNHVMFKVVKHLPPAAKSLFKDVLAEYVSAIVRDGKLNMSREALLYNASVMFHDRRTESSPLKGEKADKLTDGIFDFYSTIAHSDILLPGMDVPNEVLMRYGFIKESQKSQYRAVPKNKKYARKSIAAPELPVNLMTLLETREPNSKLKKVLSKLSGTDMKVVGIDYVDIAKQSLLIRMNQSGFRRALALFSSVKLREWTIKAENFGNSLVNGPYIANYLAIAATTNVLISRHGNLKGESLTWFKAGTPIEKILLKESHLESAFVKLAELNEFIELYGKSFDPRDEKIRAELASLLFLDDDVQKDPSILDDPLRKFTKKVRDDVDKAESILKGEMEGYVESVSSDLGNSLIQIAQKLVESSLEDIDSMGPQVKEYLANMLKVPEVFGLREYVVGNKTALDVSDSINAALRMILSKAEEVRKSSDDLGHIPNEVLDKFWAEIEPTISELKAVNSYLEPGLEDLFKAYESKDFEGIMSYVTLMSDSKKDVKSRSDIFSAVKDTLLYDNKITVDNFDEYVNHLNNKVKNLVQVLGRSSDSEFASVYYQLYEQVADYRAAAEKLNVVREIKDYVQNADFSDQTSVAGILAKLEHIVSPYKTYESLAKVSTSRERYIDESKDEIALSNVHINESISRLKAVLKSISESVDDDSIKDLISETVSNLKKPEKFMGLMSVLMERLSDYESKVSKGEGFEHVIEYARGVNVSGIIPLRDYVAIQYNNSINNVVLDLKKRLSLYLKKKVKKDADVMEYLSNVDSGKLDEYVNALSSLDPNFAEANGDLLEIIQSTKSKAKRARAIKAYLLRYVGLTVSNEMDWLWKNPKERLQFEQNLYSVFNADSKSLSSIALSSLFVDNTVIKSINGAADLKSLFQSEVIKLDSLVKDYRNANVLKKYHSHRIHAYEVLKSRERGVVSSTSKFASLLRWVGSIPGLRLFTRKIGSLFTVGRIWKGKRSEFNQMVQTASLMELIGYFDKKHAKEFEELGPVAKSINESLRSWAYLSERNWLAIAGVYRTFSGSMHTRAGHYGLSWRHASGMQFAGPIDSTLMQVMGNTGGNHLLKVLFFSHGYRKALKMYRSKLGFYRWQSGIPNISEPMKFPRSSRKGSIYRTFEDKIALIGEGYKTFAKEMPPSDFLPFMFTHNPSGSVRITELLDFISSFRSSPYGPRDVINYLMFQPNDADTDFQDILYSLKEGRSMKKSAEHLYDVGVYGTTHHNKFIAGREITIYPTQLNPSGMVMYPNRITGMFDTVPFLAMPGMYHIRYGDIYHRVESPELLAYQDFRYSQIGKSFKSQFINYFKSMGLSVVLPLSSFLLATSLAPYGLWFAVGGGAVYSLFKNRFLLMDRFRSFKSRKYDFSKGLYQPIPYGNLERAELANEYLNRRISSSMPDLPHGDEDESQ